MTHHKFMKIILTASCLIVGTAMAVKAQEVPEARTEYVAKAFLCDTEDQMHRYVSAVALNGGEAPEGGIPGCGMWSPRGAHAAMVTPLYWYETPQGKWLATRFLFTVSGWLQFGMTDFIPNEDFEAALLSTPL